MIKLKALTVGLLETNCYIISNNKEAIIIDPGAEPENIISEISNDVLVKYIILTHAHFDHIGAIDVICEKYQPVLLMNKGDYEFLKNPQYNLSASFRSNKCIIKYDKIQFVNDETINLIGQDFTFIHTPGHTPGSMCVKYNDILHTGDTLFLSSIGNAFPPFGDMQTEIDSIKTKLFSLEGNYTCLPGHGLQTTLDFERFNNQYVGENNSGY